jgi:hypothetical protein
MLYLPISSNWLFSKNAKRVYLASALLALCLIATLIGSRTAMRAAGIGRLTPTAAPLVRALLLPGILGAGVLWTGMWHFWFSFDRSHYLKKAIWFAILFFLVPLGTLAYYFFVYRKCVRSLPDCGTPAVIALRQTRQA